MNPSDLTGGTALVTGAASGIGRERVGAPSAPSQGCSLRALATLVSGWKAVQANQ